MELKSVMKFMKLTPGFYSNKMQRKIPYVIKPIH